MSLTDALQTPIDFEGVKFARWDMDDLALWASQIKAARKVKSTEQLKANTNLDPLQKLQMMRAIEEEDVQIYELLAKTVTPAGIRRVLTTSLKKSGQCATDDEATVILKRIHFMVQRDLAYQAMSAPEPEKSRPLAESGIAATGEPISASSENGAELTPES